MIRVALLHLAAVSALLAQSAPGAGAAKSALSPEDALRARVTEFLQYHVESNFRKAMDLVAEDTKDAYFATGKLPLKAFKIDSITLSDNNTRGVVNSTITRNWQLRMQDHEVVVPMVTTWKLENGQWFWYWDLKSSWLTPMGPSDVEPPTRNSDGTVNLPKSLAPEVIAQRAQQILAQSSLSKGEVKIDPGKTSQERVFFTNGVQGTVRVSLDGVPNLPGFSARLEKSEVGANEQVQLMVSYTPPADDAEPPNDFTMQILTEPLNQGYPVRISFVKPTP